MVRRLMHTGVHFFCSCFLLTMLLPLQLSAQEKHALAGEPFFKRFADSTISSFQQSHSYYIFSSELRLPVSVRVVRQLDNHSAILSIGNSAGFESLRKQGNISAANNRWKFAPGIEGSLIRTDRVVKRYLVSGDNIDALQASLTEHRGQVNIIRTNAAAHSVIIETTTSYLLDHLLPLQEIIFIDRPGLAHSEANIIGYDRSFHGLSAVDYSIPGANGKNIVVGIKEQRMDAADLDLHKRVLSSSIEAPAMTSHATVIASIVGGAGNSFYDGRGIAYACKFFPSSFGNLFADDPSILAAQKVSVQNHSYGSVVQQFYGAEAVSYDALTWRDQKMVAVFSAGNQGTTAATDGVYANIAGYANLTGNFKMAKNVITVGAIDGKGRVPAESSAGPVYDGRVAPQLIALGPNGTSDAAAIVSGTAAVLQQVYADSNNNELPAASLVKALLYNTADDINLPGIDYKTGYGLLNSFDAIRSLQQRHYLEGSITQGQEWVSQVTIPANAAQFKMTLCWTDTIAQVNNLRALINDLDLELVQQSSGEVYQPWVLDASPMLPALSAPPIRRRDSLNTSEQVSLRLPVAGSYQVRVKGTKISSGSMPFSVAYQTDTLNTFQFLSPQHASDVIREEKPEVLIKWKTFVADSTMPGKLFISYNRGADWKLLDGAVKIYTNQAAWQLPDTGSTALLKMETGFGNFFSKEFIVHPVTRLAVDFVCSDSFRISWRPHIYANAYKIFALTDSPYLKEITRVVDTFIVLNRTPVTPGVYAVEPVLVNGIPAARSIATDIEQQGVNCFYRTLNYALLDGNALDLKLDISAPSYTDSVYFEQVSAAGVLLQSYGGAKARTATNIYSQLVKQAPAGITYLRGKIKLLSGAVVYTDIIPVLTSGNKILRFYPNPVDRSATLNHVLQQGISPGNTLQFFDASGRLLKTYDSIPDRVDVSKFPAGLIIYKLLENAGTVLETGKIILL